jgi:hypothetical protein
MEIQILCITKIALWGRPPYGGNRPQRGFIWGKPPPTRFYMGETAPNAVLYGGNRPQRGFIWGKPPPTRFYQEAIERLLSYI